jgi:HEAT repeat protein
MRRSEQTHFSNQEQIDNFKIFFEEVSKMKTLMKISCAMFLILLIGSSAYAQKTSDQEYNQYLINSLNDENIGIRTSAAQLLGERKVQEAVDPLIKMLKSEKQYSARIVVAVALFNIGDEKALPELKKVAKSDKDKCVRVVAAAIVQKMQTPEVTLK